MRNILSGLAGLISAVFATGLVQWMGNSLFASDVPFPEKREDLAQYMQQLPFMAKFFVVLGYAVGGFVAGIVASFIQGRTYSRPGIVAAGVLQLFAWMNMMSFPHPFWMWLFGSVAIIPMSWLAFKLIRKTKPLE